MNGFGYAARETGHKRVPAPPQRMTETILFIAPAFYVIFDMPDAGGGRDARGEGVPANLIAPYVVALPEPRETVHLPHAPLGQDPFR